MQVSTSSSRTGETVIVGLSQRNLRDLLAQVENGERPGHAQLCIVSRDEWNGAGPGVPVQLTVYVEPDDVHYAKLNRAPGRGSGLLS